MINISIIMRFHLYIHQISYSAIIILFITHIIINLNHSLIYLEHFILKFIIIKG